MEKMLMRWVGFVVIPLVMVSCATVQYDQEQDGSPKIIAQLQGKILDNPNNAEVLRDLGVIYFQTKQYSKAEEYLKRSSVVNDKDPKTLFYYGMTLEYEKKTQAALATYINYSDFSSLSQYRKLMEGRYHELVQNVIKEQLQTLLAQEQQLGDQAMSSSTVAVFPLQFQSADEKYSSLGLGLSEMMTIDLGQVQSIKLVERLRIDALLNELAFGQSKGVDPATAPRLGRLLTAGRIVSGSYNISKEEKLRMDVSSWDVAKKDYPEPTTKSDRLDNLFSIEKDLVFAVIKSMGITLTREEQERIQRIPTKNLQAFLMYSIGLEKDNAGDFQAAVVYYRQALSLDPNFSLAKTKADAAESLSLAGGSVDHALLTAYTIDPPIELEVPPTHNPLFGRRLFHLGMGIGSMFYPGQDNRKAAEEAARAGAAVGDLDFPPSPPRQ